MRLPTFGQEVGDVQLQGRNDFVKHLEFLPEARHLEDEAGGHLNRSDHTCDVIPRGEELTPGRRQKKVY